MFLATALPRFREESARTFVVERRGGRKNGRLVASVMDARTGPDISIPWREVPADIRKAAKAAFGVK
jgi:hypothetical protein